MRWSSSTLSVLVALALAATVHAGNRGTPAEISRALAALKKDPGNPKLLTDAGSQFALRASEQGYPTDVEDARRYLRQSLKMDPTSAQTVAWLGVLRCIEAKVRQTRGYVRDGLAQLDRAVEMAPDDLVVRMVRGSVSVEVPRDFNRVDGGLEDLEIVRAAHDQDPHRLSMHRIEAAEVYLKLGKGYRAKGNLELAKQMWVRAAEGPPGRDRETASRLLSKFGSKP